MNEAIVEDGSYRKSKFYEILGEEFIPLAFQYAHEADPDAELYYNDYGMDVQGRREGVVKLVRSLKEKDCVLMLWACKDTWEWITPTSRNLKKVCLLLLQLVSR